MVNILTRIRFDAIVREEPVGSSEAVGEAGGAADVWRMKNVDERRV
jgi:hypothetical protein